MPIRESAELGQEARRAERGMDKLSVGDGTVGIEAELSDGIDRCCCRHCYENGGGCAAVSVDVRASVVGAGLLRIGIAMAVLSGCLLVRGREGVVHVLMHEGVRLGELRRVQNRQLAAAEHGYGEQYGDQELFDDPFHGRKQTRIGAVRQVEEPRLKISRRHLTAKVWFPSVRVVRKTH